MLKTIIALTVAAGFASAAFAQTGAPAPTPTNAPSVKVTVPAPTPAVAPVEKKMDVTKAAEPVKADASKTTAPAKTDVAVKTEAVKADTKPAKVKHTSKTTVVPDVKGEPVAPTVK
jgi:hypothetical protein